MSCRGPRELLPFICVGESAPSRAVGGQVGPIGIVSSVCCGSGGGSPGGVDRFAPATAAMKLAGRLLSSPSTLMLAGEYIGIPVPRFVSFHVPWNICREVFSDVVSAQEGMAVDVLSGDCSRRSVSAREYRPPVSAIVMFSPKCPPVVTVSTMTPSVPESCSRISGGRGSRSSSLERCQSLG